MNKNFIVRTGRSNFRRRNPFRGFSGRVSRIAKRTINRMSEYKYAWFFNHNTHTIADTYIDEVTPRITQGVGKNNRVGRSIQYKNLRFNVGISGWVDAAYPIRTALAPLMQVRIMLVQSRNSIGVTKQIVFDQFTEGDNLSLAYIPTSSINPSGVRVLRDEKFSMLFDDLRPARIAHVGNGNLMAKNFDWFVRVHNHVTYSSSDAELPTTPQDKYYVIAYAFPYDKPGDNGAVYNNLANISYNLNWSCKLGFIDV